MWVNCPPSVSQAQVEAKKEHEGAVYLLEVSVWTPGCGEGGCFWDVVWMLRTNQWTRGQAGAASWHSSVPALSRTFNNLLKIHFKTLHVYENVLSQNVQLGCSVSAYEHCRNWWNVFAGCESVISRVIVLFLSLHLFLLYGCVFTLKQNHLDSMQVFQNCFY